MHAQIVLFDGFDPMDVVGPYEVLYAGGLASGGALSVELVSAEGPRTVLSGSGELAMTATATLDVEHADLIIVPEHRVSSNPMRTSRAPVCRKDSRPQRKPNCLS